MNPNSLGGSTPVVDPIFEALYASFKGQVGLNVLLAPEILETYPEAYRSRIFDRWGSDSQVIVGPPPTRIGQDKTWRSGYSSANGAHWFALRTFLQTVKDFPQERLNALDMASDSILYSLGDPELQTASSERRKFAGLVVGYVQSGKTANYTALTAKAFDAGFKLVIVLSGLHNGLRRQTQMRMNDELGLIPSTPERPTAEATFPLGLTPIQTLTSEDLTSGDFRYTHLASSILNSGKFLCVTKKNVQVLTRLRKWLGSNLTVPVLIIDDEADQASIDARSGPAEDFDADRDPTAINKQIRSLIKDCTRYSAYIGYTATPYANVFINRDAKHSNLDKDLYPRDFILSLPKPKGYMGPEEFFGPNLTGEEAGQISVSERVIEIVSDEERNKALSLQKDELGNSVLPLSMMKAVKEFVLGTAVRRAKEGGAKPSSFLAHTSHRQADQLALGAALERFMMQLHNDWRYDKDRVAPEWQHQWDIMQADMLGDAFRCKFTDLMPHLDELLGQFGTISVRILNFKSPDELDYDLEPNLCAIVVGGNKLSRGLTLEGLLVSYFVRQSSQPQADTLTQMGRFFGYRGDLVDITRVYTTDQLRSEFREISHMESALRRDIELYARSGKTPADFAPRVMKRAGLLPTSRMGAAREFGVTYSGDLIQTTSFSPSMESEDDNLRNLNVTKEFIKKVDGLAAERIVAAHDNGSPTKLLWKSIPSDVVIQFIRDYKTVRDAKRFSPQNIANYIQDQMSPGSASPELLRWNVAVIGRSIDPALGSESFGLDIAVGRSMRSMEKGSPRSIGTLINPLTPNLSAGDELIDFTPQMLRQALSDMESYSIPAGQAVRAQRDPEEGLLLVYPLSPDVITTGNPAESPKALGETLNYNGTFVGLALVFPNTNQDQSGRTFWRQH